MASLLAESAGFGDPPMNPSGWMNRGNWMESEARKFYAFHQDIEIIQVDWITNNEGTAGCSPDGLILLSGSWRSNISPARLRGLEIKNPKASTHLEWTLGGILPPKHRQQIHLSMAVTKIREWVFLSYFPGLKPFIHLERWGEYTDCMVDAIEIFTHELRNAARSMILDRDIEKHGTGISTEEKSIDGI
jgi:hypothetical protein